MDIKQVRKIIKNISFAPSNLDMGWQWQVKNFQDGFLIRTSFQRPDTHTGKIGRGFGRFMFVDKNTSEEGLVMTAWICAELIIKHELMECFMYKSVRILDPHKSLQELAFPHELGTNYPLISQPETTRLGFMLPAPKIEVRKIKK